MEGMIMKVEIITLTEECVEENEYRNLLRIKIDNNKAFDVGDGEPEDNTLARNFNDCLKIDSLMQIAWIAGKNGENMSFIHTEIDNFDLL